MSGPSKTHRRPIVVVAAEDEMLLRMVAVEALTDEAFIAIEVGHATAALDVCNSRANEIDVLFTNIRMPGSRDGLRLAHRVRGRWPQISVVIASGNLCVPPEELPEGAWFPPKPYDMRYLVHVIREMCQNYQGPAPGSTGPVRHGIRSSPLLHIPSTINTR